MPARELCMAACSLCCIAAAACLLPASLTEAPASLLSWSVLARRSAHMSAWVWKSSCCVISAGAGCAMDSCSPSTGELSSASASRIASAAASALNSGDSEQCICKSSGMSIAISGDTVARPSCCGCSSSARCSRNPSAAIASTCCAVPLSFFRPLFLEGRFVTVGSPSGKIIGSISASRALRSLIFLASQSEPTACSSP